MRARSFVEIDAARFASGEYRPGSDRPQGRGDVYASYSADRIGEGKPIRKPFAWNGGLWVCIGIGPDAVTATAYKVIPAESHKGPIHTYRDRFRRDHRSTA